MTSGRFISYDGSVLPGMRRLVTVPEPAAGSDWNVIVPGGRMWRILAGNVPFTASATVASRAPGITLAWQGETYWNGSTEVAIVASTATSVSFGILAASATAKVGGSPAIVPLPLGWVPDSTVVASLTTAIQTTDQYGPVAMLVEELWVTDQELTEAETVFERALAALASQSAPAQPTTGGAST